MGIKKSDKQTPSQGEEYVDATAGEAASSRTNNNSYYRTVPIGLPYTKAILKKMHIKRVVLRGFKTYKDQTEVEFSPNSNVVVGKNGSGKSNLLTAIEFVTASLSLRGKEKSYLHEGTSTAVLTGHIDVILDNSDRRFGMFDADEVIIRRVFGTKKDDIYINGKLTTKAEFNGILESAGFSKTNPYHIVRQGKVAELTVMSDDRRLKLLKDVAGTKVYDERRQQALSTLNDNKHREIEVDRTLELIVKRVTELERQHSDLKNYNEIEKKIKEQECFMAELEVQQAEDEMRSTDDLRSKLVQEKQALDDLSSEMQQRIVNIEMQCLDRVAQEAQVTRKMDSLKKHHLEVQEEYRKAKMNRDTHVESSSKLAKSRSKMIEELKDTDGKIQQYTNKTDQNLKVALDSDREKYLNAKLQKSQLRNEIEELIEKKDRCRTVTSTKDRNICIQKDIQIIETRMSRCRKEIQEKTNEMNGLEKDSQTDKSLSKEHQTELSDQLENLKVQHRHYLQIHKATKHDADSLNMEVSDLRHKLKRLDDEINISQNEADRKLREVERTMRETQARAIRSAKQWSDTRRLVLGTLLENIKVQEKHRIAVEVVAGLSLFNVLVKDRYVQRDLSTYMKNRREGGIVLVPLLDIRNKTRRIDKNLMGDKARLMIEVVEHDDEISPAVEQVFGKYLLVDDRDTGNVMRKEFNMNCVTLDGDIISCKGVLSGGFRQNLKRMKAYADYRELNEKKKKSRD